ncbi:MAG TPA: hypothetical protein VFI14_12635, partial [Chryseosolibacter sp.]|nr:hypothetical protein [Chryseosolibacter sp.]
MNGKRFLRYVWLTGAGIGAFLILLLASSLAPVDRTPASTLPSYNAMMKRLDTLKVVIPKPATGFSVGFGKVNITPDEPMATAGYGKRKGKRYVNVHDSIYVRSMVIDNGSERVAIVAADLLIIPPT